MVKEKKAGLFRTEVMAPLLLSTVVLSATAYIYACGNASAVLLFSFLSAAYSAALFVMYEKLRAVGKNWLTTVVVISAFLGVQFIGFQLADMRAIGDFGLWFMEPSRYTQVHFGNTYTLILAFGFVLVSSLYYFTRIRYRGVFVFLICLCPFCLFAKTFTDIPVIFPIVVMTLFFFIMTGRSGTKKLSPEFGKGVLRTTLAFVLAVTVVASFFPKLRTAPFREAFDEFITGVSIGAEGIADFSDFSNNSSSATPKDDDDSAVLSFYGDNPSYIKRQCFNLYDRSMNTWGYYGDENNGHNKWARFTRFEDPTSLYEELGFDTGAIKKKQCLIRYASGRVRALYTADNITSIVIGGSDEDVYRTELDEYFTNINADSYVMGWVEFPLNAEFIAGLTDEKAKEISESSESELDVDSYIRAKKQAVMYNDHLLSDEVMDECYSSAEARAKVRAFAEEITAGCASDAEKAAAIAERFKNSEYIYDDDYTTSNASPDNFIFGTKRGACAAYATAMTLMCRELGMTARYCEGFFVHKYDEINGCWYVTASDSHAFVQVWIDGYGWTTFDPTSNIKDSGYFDVTFMYVGIGAAVLFLIFALVVFLRPVFAEAGFVKRMKKARGTAQYSMIYCRINAMLNRYLGSAENRFTPTETADKCREYFGLDISGFVRDYESAVYGGKVDESSNNSAVYTDFVAAYRKTRSEGRKRMKKWGYSARKK